MAACDSWVFSWVEGGLAAKKPQKSAIFCHKISGNEIYLPRFDARGDMLPRPGRGFGVQIYQYPGTHARSHFLAVTFGEMPPRPENRVTLHPTRRDAWGIPVLYIECGYSDADLARAREQAAAIRELGAAVGVTLSCVNHRPTAPGIAIHECGTARMGRDLADSVLDPHNQCWEAEGLYVTDGACFPSQGTQKPHLDHPRAYYPRMPSRRDWNRMNEDNNRIRASDKTRTMNVFLFHVLWNCP